jgi:hypothetical protein
MLFGTYSVVFVTHCFSIRLFSIVISVLYALSQAQTHTYMYSSIHTHKQFISSFQKLFNVRASSDKDWIFEVQ